MYPLSPNFGSRSRSRERVCLGLPMCHWRRTLVDSFTGCPSSVLGSRQPYPSGPFRLPNTLPKHVLRQKSLPFVLFPPSPLFHFLLWVLRSATLSINDPENPHFLFVDCVVFGVSECIDNTDPSRTEVHTNLGPSSPEVERNKRLKTFPRIIFFFSLFRFQSNGPRSKVNGFTRLRRVTLRTRSLKRRRERLTRTVHLSRDDRLTQGSRDSVTRRDSGRTTYLRLLG